MGHPYTFSGQEIRVPERAEAGCQVAACGKACHDNARCIHMPCLGMGADHGNGLGYLREGYGKARGRAAIPQHAGMIALCQKLYSDGLSLPVGGQRVRTRRGR